MQIESPTTCRDTPKPQGERRGLVIVHTGDGKGKSTAAFGLALRAHGRGKAVMIYQFMKVPSARFGEHRLFEQIGLPIVGLGDGFSWKSRDLEHSALALPAWLGVPLLALAFKPTFAWRMLRDETAAVESSMSSGLDLARERLSRLVSRDVSAFDESLLRESALETLAENLNDSVIAPLLWTIIAGLPGAVLYRFANTADAMWGYRGAWEWAGKWAARADDVLSWLPARLSALLIAPRVVAQRWSRLRQEALQTPSPNGGWPMAALALALDVRLRKPGVYALNAQAVSPTAASARLATRRCSRAAWTMAALVCASLLAFA